MSKNSAIEIYLRVRPTKKPFPGLTLHQDDARVEFHVPKEVDHGFVNNKKEKSQFKFNHLLGMDAKQDRVFNDVAKDVVDSALDGYNGTIFAYGQTGSGKTFTMTGGAENYEDRGIIPRTISYLFQETSNRTDTFYKMSVSYMEIYDNKGYDLLDENHTNKNLTDLREVTPHIIEDEKVYLEDLSKHKAESEQQTLKLLLIGDINRAVCETPKNDASTRSHCIFMINIEGQKTSADGRKIESTIYLVDLSGSERVGKTGVDGKLLREARFINLSLHYLEHVILQLNKKERGETGVHVPYRNSLMTLILKDSLGGNSKTKMIATVSANKEDIDESISTCAFAMRVAEIKNAVQKNESMDPYIIIQKLKKENEELKAEISLLKGGQGKVALDQGDIEECKNMVERFIADPDPGARIILKDMLMINECFYFFKHKFNDLYKRYDKQSSVVSKKKILNEGLDMESKAGISSENQLAMNEEIQRLEMLVKQRDNEIMILLSLINKGKSTGENENTYVPVSGANTSVIVGGSQDTSRIYNPITFPKLGEKGEVVGKILDEEPKQSRNQTPQKNNILEEEKTKPLDIIQKRLRNEELNTSHTNSVMSKTTAVSRNEIENFLVAPLSLTNEQLKDRATCWELFRKSYRKNQALEETKATLKEKYDEARANGAKVEECRNKILSLKNQIENIRKEQARQGLFNDNNEVRKHPDEDKLTQEINQLKQVYQACFTTGKNLKSEIEGMQGHLERSHQQLQRDFDKWLDVMLSQNTAIPSKTLMNTMNTTNTLKESQKSNLNTTNLSGITQSNRSKASRLDPEVEKNLAAFYQARDELHKQI